MALLGPQNCFWAAWNVCEGQGTFGENKNVEGYRFLYRASLYNLCSGCLRHAQPCVELTAVMQRTQRESDASSPGTPATALIQGLPPHMLLPRKTYM